MHAKKQTTRMLATMIALAATAGLATTASRADSVDGPRYANVVVDYSDLNLDTAAGNQKLYARLANAAARACGNEPSTRDIERKAQYKACVESTLNRAVDKVSTSDQRALRERAVKDGLG